VVEDGAGNKIKIPSAPIPNLRSQHKRMAVSFCQNRESVAWLAQLEDGERKSTNTKSLPQAWYL
jgi:hypothetical protein